MKKILFVFLFLFSFSVHAEESIFKIDKIKVSVEALTQEEARNKAIADGELKAFEALEQRFLDYGYITTKPKIAPAKISSAIDKMEINNEKTTSRTYSATLNFTFKPDITSKIFGVQITDNKINANRFLLVPVVVSVNEYKIWDTPWAKLWQDYKKPNIIIPVGDLEDLKSLKPDDLQANNFFGVDLLARRYKTPIIILLEAQYISSQNAVRVTLKRLEESGMKVYQLDYTGGIGVGASELYVKAANDISSKLATNQFAGMKEADNKISYERDFRSKGTEALTMNKIEAMVPARNLSSWIRTRRKILSIPMVDGVEVKSFNLGKAQVNIRFNGSVDDFAGALKNYGLELEGVEPDYKIIDEFQSKKL